MEPTTNLPVDLFGGKLPSVEKIYQLSDFVHSSERSEKAFSEQLERNKAKSSKGNTLAVGIGLHTIGRNAEAVEALRKAKNCREKFVFLARALRQTGHFDQAVETLQKSLDYDADALTTCLEKAATYRLAGDSDAAEKELQNCADFENVNAEYNYQLGRVQESQGRYESAMENYTRALDLSPNHQRALFHLAYRCDLSGDEEAAIDYYKQIASTSPVYVNALLNLAVLYEDKGLYDNAEYCVAKVLQCHPNHQRAILFQKDIESSKTMYYDEEKEKRKTRKNQIVETPISDFELSVRSRNCLKKMNIETIGDLLNISEAELLSYKNFGETSLKEIKVILDSKGLHLGMALEEKQSSALSDEIEETDARNKDILSKSVDELRLSVRARKCLERLGLRTVGEVAQKTDAELLGCKNFGLTSLNEIKRAMAHVGVSLGNLE